MLFKYTLRDSVGLKNCFRHMAWVRRSPVIHSAQQRHAGLIYGPPVKLAFSAQLSYTFWGPRSHHAAWLWRFLV
jgi:hypothetical protein